MLDFLEPMPAPLAVSDDPRVRRIQSLRMAGKTTEEIQSLFKKRERKKRVSRGG